MDNNQEIQRIIYYWRRYFGLRDGTHGKIWLSEDLNILEWRIDEYFKHPEKFDFNKPDMGIDRYGYIQDEDSISTDSALNSQEINLSGDVRNEVALQQSNSFEPKTCRLCDTARNDKSKVAPKIKNKYGQYMESDDLGRNEVGGSCKDLSNGTDKLCDSPDIHSQNKALLDKDYAPKGKDMCKCGHDYGWHHPLGDCTYVDDEDACCDCRDFVFDKQKGTNGGNNGNV